MKEQNSESALSFINYRPLVKAEHLRSKEEIHQIIARRHGFDPNLEDAFEDWDTIENSQRVDKIFDAMDYFLGVVGFVTLALGAIGIVNIMLVSVAERTREIGVRMALGARAEQVRGMVVAQGARVVGAGVAIGIAVALASTRALGSLLFGVKELDVFTFIGMSLSMVLVGLLASSLPARRASNVNPIESMRGD